uniref:TLDc domain-containing protein n=1 Tax=Strongyloides stercoralis TaxID=6248 RepID=A0A0K0ETI2_STRER
MSKNVEISTSLTSFTHKDEKLKKLLIEKKFKETKKNEMSLSDYEADDEVQNLIIHQNSEKNYRYNRKRYEDKDVKELKYKYYKNLSSNISESKETREIIETDNIKENNSCQEEEYDDEIEDEFLEVDKNYTSIVLGMAPNKNQILQYLSTTNYGRIKGSKGNDIQLTDISGFPLMDVWKKKECFRSKWILESYGRTVLQIVDFDNTSSNYCFLSNFLTNCGNFNNNNDRNCNVFGSSTVCENEINIPTNNKNLNNIKNYRNNYEIDLYDEEIIDNNNKNQFKMVKGKNNKNDKVIEMENKSSKCTTSSPSYNDNNFLNKELYKKYTVMTCDGEILGYFIKGYPFLIFDKNDELIARLECKNFILLNSPPSNEEDNQNLFESSTLKGQNNFNANKTPLNKSVVKLLNNGIFSNNVSNRKTPETSSTSLSQSLKTETINGKEGDNGNDKNDVKEEDTSFIVKDIATEIRKEKVDKKKQEAINENVFIKVSNCENAAYNNKNYKKTTNQQITSVWDCYEITSEPSNSHGKMIAKFVENKYIEFLSTPIKFSLKILIIAASLQLSSMDNEFCEWKDENRHFYGCNIM